MTTTRISDVVVPEEFTNYIVENVATKTNLTASGLLVPNSVMNTQLKAGADSYPVPVWLDLGDDEADIINDDPDSLSVPSKLGSSKQSVRKSFLHKSWSAMNLASELAGSSAINRIQDRTTAYWDRQLQKRLVSSLMGIKAANIAKNDGDMVVGISGSAGPFSAEAVIDAIGTLGDSLGDVVAIAMHSAIYLQALKNDLIETLTDSQGRPFQVFRGLAVIVDDGLTPVDGNYTSVLFGAGVFGYGISAPNNSAGTEIENKPSAGNGGGMQILHNRINLSIHPAGFSWADGVDGVVGISPTIAELAVADRWTRISERKNVKLAFLVTK